MMEPSQGWSCFEIEEQLCFMFPRSNVILPTWYFGTFGSFVTFLFPDIRNSQALRALLERLFFKRLVDAWFYNKFVHPWHVGRIVNANANHHALRFLLFYVFPMLLQGLDLWTNPFQEKENDPSMPSLVMEFKSFSSSHYIGGLKGARKEGLRFKNLLKWKYKTPLGGILGAGRTHLRCEMQSLMQPQVGVCDRKSSRIRPKTSRLTVWSCGEGCGRKWEM